MTTVDTSAAQPARRVDQWFDRYAVSHQNRANKLIHFLCVPAITFSTIGLLWAIPMPSSFGPWVNLATIVVALAMLFYLQLSLVLAIGMLTLTLPMLALFQWMSSSGNPAIVWQLSLGIFVVAWIGQLIGHKIEKAKPAFTDDLPFLLIGPIWVLAHFFGKLGIKY